MTIANEDKRNPCVLAWKDLHEVKFTFDSPFKLRLEDDQLLSVEQVVRLIPKRRMVVFGTWQGKRIVAKLFFDSQHPKRHMEKDIAGIKLLQDSKIPSPALYYQGASEDRRIFVLIYERIFDAENLDEIWQTKKSVEELYPLLQSVIIELATQHVFGILQHDLHLKNFLLTEKTIYTLDGAQIEVSPEMLQKKTSIKNLALFLAQLGVGIEDYQEKLFRYYAKSRGWMLKSEDIDELFLLINQWNEQRWQRFEKKIFRDSTNFARINAARSFGMYDRQYANPELMNFLSDPESAFQHSSAEMLKAGRSATVIKITLDQREYVVKRYNMKNLWHRLRRCLRPTRALTSWRLAQKLNLFGITTAKPVAFIEKRFFGLRSKSYYVTEYISGEHAGDFLTRYRDQQEKSLSMVKRISTLLKSIAKLEITHGDLKITNILVNAHDQPVLIDLDGTAEHASLSSLRGAWRKDMKRFLKNFHDQPSVYKKFKMELGERP